MQSKQTRTSLNEKLCNEIFLLALDVAQKPVPDSEAEFDLCVGTREQAAGDWSCLSLELWHGKGY